MKHVSILGAGLVGSLLSVYLARRGYKVDIYERRPDMRKSSLSAGRSINLALSDRGWRGIRAAGLEEEIRKTAIPMYARLIHLPDGTLSRQPYGEETQAIYSVSRGGLNMELMNLAEQNPNVTIHFQHKCEEVDLKNQLLHFKNENGKLPPVKTDLVFGADGAFSALRNSMQHLDRFDYSQTYIDHGYKELTIQPGPGGSFQMEKNVLHIWPRKNFMLIALPNADGSFTCTLFFPMKGEISFESIQTGEAVKQLFEEYFTDVIPLMPSYRQDFFLNPTSSLHTVRCYPWSYGNFACLIGDAAHAVVPFFGQGMNCGFEDCVELESLIDRYQEDWSNIFPTFQQSRKPNADAIAQMALNNFLEMRDLVADPHFLLKKKIEKKLSALLPGHFIPAYTMVTFSPEIPYSEAFRKMQQQDALLEELSANPQWETALLDRSFVQGLESRFS